MKRETKFFLGGLASGVLAGLLIAAIGLMGSVAMLKAARNARMSARSGALQGAPAHDFSLQDVNPASPTHGQVLRLSDLWEDRGVVVNFMASWCGPCRMELPALDSIGASGDATIVCVAADEEGGTDELLAIVSASGVRLPVLYATPDQAAELGRAYTHDALPSTYLIGRDGKIRRMISGARPEAAFRTAIAESLSGPSASLR